MKKALLLGAVVAVAAVVVWICLRIGEGKQEVAFVDASRREALGKMAFDGRDQDFRLQDLRGQAVLVDVWASWCGPCISEIPHLVRLQEEFQPRLTVVGLNVDQEGWQVVDPFLERHPEISYRIVRPAPPPRMITSTIIDLPPLGKVSALPTSFLIDSQGRMVSKYVGAGHTPRMERDIEKLLTEF